MRWLQLTVLSETYPYIFHAANANNTADPTGKNSRKLTSFALLVDDCELYLVVCVWNSFETEQGVVHQWSRIVFRLVLLFEIYQVHNTQIDITAGNRTTARARVSSNYRDIRGLGPDLLFNGPPKGHVDVLRSGFDRQHGRRVLFAHVRESPLGASDGLADAVGQEHTSSVHSSDDIELFLVVRRGSRRIQGFQHLLS